MDLDGRGVLVFCSSSDDAHPDYRDAARALGRGLAGKNATVVYGGASCGLMGALADATLAAGGRVVGIIPRRLVGRELAHRGLSELVEVDTMHQRKQLMSERASAYLVLPGGFGTWEELLEVATWRQLGMHRRPIVLVNVRGFFDPLLAWVERAIGDGVLRAPYREFLTVAASAEDAIARLEAASVDGGVDISWT